MIRSLENIGIIKIRNELFDSNTYIVKYQDNLAFIVDPGFSWSEIEATIDRHNLTPTHIFCTHGHFDHIGSVAPIAAKFDVCSVLHKADLGLVKSANFLMMAYGLKERIETPTFSCLVNGGEIFRLGNSEVLFESVPGHSGGSCFVFYNGVLFSGDSLYADGVGLPSPDEKKELLRESLLKWWGKIEPDTLVCPGHGQEKVFCQIRAENKALRAFLRGDGGSNGE